MIYARQKENWFETAPAYSLLFFRSALAVLSFFYFVPKLDNSIYLYLSSSFHEPMAAWLPGLPQHTGTALVFALRAAAFFLFLGILPRMAAGFLAACGLYVFLLDVRHYTHWTQFHIILLGFLALVKLPPLTRLFRKNAPPPAHELWPQYLVLYQLAIIFFFSALEKIFSPFWGLSGSFFGYDFIPSAVTKTDFMSLLHKAGMQLCVTFPSAASVLVTALEFFIAGALLFRPWRKAGILTGFFFCVALEIVAMPSLFAWDAGLCFLFLWLDKSRKKSIPALAVFAALAVLRFGKFVWH